MDETTYERQRDMFKLAQRGSGDCRRQWNTWAEAHPEQARVIVGDVGSERARRVKANKRIDKTLRRAEALLTKSEKAGKPKKAGSKPAVPVIGKSLTAGERYEVAYWSVLLREASPFNDDPVSREAARALLAAM
jgi:hypothetical protein